jgi:LPS-assembly lipoprotein
MRRRDFFTFIAALPLAGCGFQLRGKNAIPWRSLHIDAPEDSLTARQVADALRDRGITIADSAKAAEATLKISQEKQNRTVLSLSGGGRVREYRLNYAVNYGMTGADGQEIFPQSEIRQSRDFTYDDNLHLAKAAEEDFLYRDLRNDAVQQIVRRLSKTR